MSFSTGFFSARPEPDPTREMPRYTGGDGNRQAAAASEAADCGRRVCLACKCGAAVQDSAEREARRRWRFGALFLFFYFLFSFFKKIYFRFGNLHEYTGRPAAGRPTV